MIYFIIRGNNLPIGDLQPETQYPLKFRAVNNGLEPHDGLLVGKRLESKKLWAERAEVGTG